MPDTTADPHDVGAADRAHTRRGAGTNVLTLVGQSTSLLYGTIAARLFGQAAWGSYTTAAAWLDVLFRVALVGNDKGLLVFVSARRGDGDEPGAIRALVTALRVTAVSGLACTLLMAGASWLVARANGQPLDGLALRLLAPLALISSLTTAVLAATMATRTLKYNLFSRGLAEPALLLTLTALFGFVAPSMWTLAAGAVAAGTTALIVALAGLRRCFDLREVLRGLRHEPTERAVIRYTIPLALSELTNIVVFRLPIFVLVAYAVPAERAVFNTCLLLASSISAVRGTFDAVLAPIAAEAWAMGDRARLSYNLQRQSRLVLFVAIPFASLFIVGGPSWLALYGPGFASGARTLAWLAGGNVINASFALMSWVHLASGRTRLMLVNNLAMLVFELILCLVLIPRYGVEGAAIATTFMLVASQALYAIQGYSFARVHVLSSRFLRLAAIGTVIIAAEAMLVRLVVPARGSGAIVIPIVGLPVYVALAWWGGGIGRDRLSAQMP